jgi:predicted kinase
VLRSDEIRKRLAGVSPLTRLGPEAYTPAMSHRVYEALAASAARAAAAGHAAIVDAVFADAGERALVERAAAAARVPFVGVWLDAPEHVLLARVEARRSDASDADASVVRRQLARGAGEVAWHPIDAAAEPEAVLRGAAAIAGTTAGDPEDGPPG